MIVLCNYWPQTGEIRTRCDVKLLNQQYKGLWGWPGSGDMMTRLPPAVSRYVDAPPALLPEASRKRPREASATVTPRRPTWDEINRQLQPWYRKDRPEDMPTARKVRVAPVGKLLEELGYKDLSHVGEKLQPLQKKHAWSDAECFKAPRAAGEKAASDRKQGGKTEWVAVEAALEQCFNKWIVAASKCARR